MPTPLYSGHEILALVLDEANKRLRVDAKLSVDNISVENANLEVHLEANPDVGQDADSLIIAGTTDGLFPGLGPNTTTRPILVSTAGRPQVDIFTSALPAGAATQATLSALLSELQLKADLLETQPVSVASLPLPAGASTEATLSALNVKLLVIPGGDPTAASIQVIPGSATGFNTTAVPVGLTPTTIAFTNSGRRGLLIFNNGPDTIFIGSGSVTTATGIPIPAGASMSMDVPARFVLTLNAVTTVAQVSPADTRILEMT